MGSRNQIITILAALIGWIVGWLTQYFFLNRQSSKQERKDFAVVLNKLKNASSNINAILEKWMGQYDSSTVKKIHEMFKDKLSIAIQVFDSLKEECRVIVNTTQYKHKNEYDDIQKDISTYLEKVLFFYGGGGYKTECADFFNRCIIEPTNSLNAKIDKLLDKLYKEQRTFITNLKIKTSGKKKIKKRIDANQGT